MISFVTTRRPPTPAARRPVIKPAVANKVVETNCVPVSETRLPSAPVKSIALPTTQLIAVEVEPKSAVEKPLKNKGPVNKATAKKATAKKAAAKSPKTKADKARVPIPKRTSVHDVARTENMRKRIDQLEASAQNGAQADAFSARTLIAAVIVLLVAALLVPTLRGAIDQSEHIAEQRARLESSQAQLAKLDDELAHWEQPDEEQDAEAWARYRAFIETQARTRINYVRPGDKVWRPVGGDILAEDVDPITGIRVTDGVVGATAGQSWYHALLESFLVANGPVEDGPTDLNELANRNR